MLASSLDLIATGCSPNDRGEPGGLIRVRTYVHIDVLGVVESSVISLTKRSLVYDAATLHAVRK